MLDCAASGEPLIKSMSPEIDPHPTTLEQTLIQKLVGPLRHHSAWEVNFHLALTSSCALLIVETTYIQLAVATPQGETRAEEIVSRPLASHHQQDRYRPSSRRYHLTSSSLYRRPTWTQLVTLQSPRSTAIANTYVILCMFSGIRSIPPSEMQWTTRARCSPSLMSTRSSTSPTHLMNSIITRTRLFTSYVGSFLRSREVCRHQLICIYF